MKKAPPVEEVAFSVAKGCVVFAESFAVIRKEHDDGVLIGLAALKKADDSAEPLVNLIDLGIIERLQMCNAGGA